MLDFFKIPHYRFGFIVNVRKPQKIKEVLIEFCTKLQSATEDKVYLYSSKRDNLPRWISESVAIIANSSEEKIEIETAFRKTIDLICQGDWDSQKWIVYITDKKHSESDLRRIQRCVNYDKKNDKGCFFMMTIETDFPEIKSIAIEELRENLLEIISENHPSEDV